ncbi:MAG TPA: dTMP kinase [Candidatus Sulfotelmatobacter sp.]|jgi:dTMP kinase|nr:dTMP kinase [Candidatus Sulfotelmatobacter sp.]
MKYHISFDIDFKRNPYKGLYITLEGIDGSGKTKQAEGLKNYFVSKKKEVLLVSEPRKDSKLFSDLVHQILLGKISLSPIALQYLFSADRVQNQEENVIPALKAGKIVISHRAFWSIVPYAISDLDPKLYNNTAQFLLVANNVLSMYHQFILPDITFYLDVSVNEAMRRLRQRKNKQQEFYEKEEKLRKHTIGYQWEMKTFPKEFTIIDGNQSPEQVKKQIIKKILEKKK